MKSQDILVAVKLVSVHVRFRQMVGHSDTALVPEAWEGWNEDSSDSDLEVGLEDQSLQGPRWTYAQLSRSVGISASECNAAVRRGLSVGLLRHARGSRQPVPVRTSLKEFLIHGFKYVFPVEYGSLVRGIPTGPDAPVLSSRIVGATSEPAVWPDEHGLKKGIALNPLHRSIPFAVRLDPILYEVFSLLDSVRSGRPREADLAASLVSERLDMLR